MLKCSLVKYFLKVKELSVSSLKQKKTDYAKSFAMFLKNSFAQDHYKKAHSPYQRKNMGMIWQMLGHNWPICGNDMGR